MVHLCVPRSATAIDAFTPTVYALRPTIYPHAHAHGPNDDHSSRAVRRVKRATRLRFFVRVRVRVVRSEVFRVRGSWSADW